MLRPHRLDGDVAAQRRGHQRQIVAGPLLSGPPAALRCRTARPRASAKPQQAPNSYGQSHSKGTKAVALTWADYNLYRLDTGYLAFQRLRPDDAQSQSAVHIISCALPMQHSSSS